MGRFIFFARRALVIITLFFLLGCESNKLSKEIRDEAKGGDLYSSDSIKTVSMTPVGGGKYGWVFNGIHFDYSLSSGVDEFLRLIVSGKLDKTHIEMNNSGVFILSRNKKSFAGVVDFTYHYYNEEERKLIWSVTRNPNENCHWNYDKSGVCNISLTELRGTIHQKSIVPTDAFKFNHAFNVNFYTEGSPSFKQEAYPVKIAKNVVMAPLYVLVTILILPVYILLSAN